MLKKIVLIYLILNSNFSISKDSNVDLNIVGFILSSDGLGKIPLQVIDCLKDFDVAMNFVPTRKANFISPNTDLQIQRILNNDHSKLGNVALYTDLLSFGGESHCNFIPKSCLGALA